MPGGSGTALLNRHSPYFREEVSLLFLLLARRLDPPDLLKAGSEHTAGNAELIQETACLTSPRSCTMEAIARSSSRARKGAPSVAMAALF